MRKLKLQMHITLDGFAATIDNGPIDLHWSDDLKEHAVTNLADVDYILIGRKTAEGFIPYWADKATKPTDEEFPVGKAITPIPKVVFSRQGTTSTWPDAKVVTGDLITEVNKLKNEEGNYLMVYGGVEFVASLITANLVDEYHLFIEPYAMGEGMPIFKQKTPLRLVKSARFENGVILNQYGI